MRNKLQWSLIEIIIFQLKKYVWRCRLRYGGHFVQGEIRPSCSWLGVTYRDITLHCLLLSAGDVMIYLLLWIIHAWCMWEKLLLWKSLHLGHPRSAANCPHCSLCHVISFSTTFLTGIVSMIMVWLGYNMPYYALEYLYIYPPMPHP